MTDTTPTDARAILRLSGEARRDFLQGLVSQDIDGLSPEQPIFACLLTPQGKILFEFFLVEAGEDILIDCAAADADALLKRLTLYKLRAKVTIERADDLFISTSAEEPGDTGLIDFEDPRNAALGWRSISAAAISEPHDAYNARRIAACVAELGADFTADQMFLLDVNYDCLNGVSYKKGCFVGQEVTSRMKRKGEVRKRTLLINFDGTPPAKGTPVMAGEASIGEMLSGIDGAGLALIRLDRWEKAKAASDALSCDGRPMQLKLPAYLK